VWLGARHLVLRCVAVWLAASGAGLLAAGFAGPGVVPMLTRQPEPSFETALVGVASCALLCCATWMWVTTTLTVVEALRRRPSRRAVTGLRRWVLVACGVVAISTPLAPAVADHHGLPTPLPYPDRAVAPHHQRPPVVQDPRVIVVRPGDSLWTIAGRDLGPGASDAEVTARWQALYAANRRVIGPDPDLIEPGLRLLQPGKDMS